MVSGQQGHLGAALALGKGESWALTVCSRSAVELPYVTVGSGSLRATAMFADEFRTDMEEVEAEAGE